MHALRMRTYVAYQWLTSDDACTPLGTVCAPTRAAARDLAAHWWPTMLVYDMLRVRAAGSVSMDLLIEALAKDGCGI